MLRGLLLLLLLLLGVALGASVHAAELKIGLVSRADDERIAPRRAELGYLGQPGGTMAAAIEMAIEEASFELGAAKLEPQLTSLAVTNAPELGAALQKLEKAGVAAVVLDVPADWLAGATAAVRLPLLNAGSADDRLRGSACASHLFHTLPAERMRSDAIAQALTARRWQRVLVLHGPSAEDAARLATAQASLKRFGLKVTATKPFKLSADPRERDLGNPALLTAPASAGGEYDAVWVVDSDGEFARGLSYRTALPRPVVGDGGLAALAWAPNFERFGAPQLSRRFAKAARRPMTGPDWAGYMAAKAVLQAALENPKTATPAALLKSMRAESFVLDGFKGTRVSFRAWDRQLRQPMLLSDGLGVIAIAPVEGILHPKNVLDTLGADAPEAQCKPK